MASDPTLNPPQWLITYGPDVPGGSLKSYRVVGYFTTERGIEEAMTEALRLGMTRVVRVNSDGLVRMAKGDKEVLARSPELLAVIRGVVEVLEAASAGEFSAA